MIGYLLSAIIVVVDILVAAAGYQSLSVRGLLFASSVVLGSLAYELLRSKDRPSEALKPILRSNAGGLRLAPNERQLWLITCGIFNVAFSSSLVAFFVFDLPLGWRGVFSCLIAIPILVQLCSGLHRSNAGRLAISVESAIFTTLGALELHAIHPLYYGDLDPIVHETFVDALTQSGTVSSGSLGIYANFPLFHVLASETAQLGGLSSIDAMFICILIGSLAGIAAFFVICKLLFRSTVAAGIASLLLASGFEWLYIAISPRPQSLSMIFFVVLLLALCGRRIDLARAAVAVLISIAWVLTHQISVLFAASFLVAMVALDRLAPRQFRVLQISPNLVLYVGVLIGGYWLVISSFGDWLVPVVAQRLTGFTSYNYSQLYSLGGTSDIAFLISTLGFVPLLSLLVLGFLWLLTGNARLDGVRNWLTLSILAMAFYVPNPLWLAPTFSGLGLDRLGRTLEPVVAIGASLVLGTMVGIRPGHIRLGNRGAVLTVVVVVSIAVGFTAASGLRPNSDSLTDLIGVAQPRLYFDADEMAAVAFVQRYVPDTNSIASDVPTTALLVHAGYIRALPFTVFRNGALQNGFSYSIVRLNAYENGGLLVLEAESANNFAPLIHSFSRITDLPDSVNPSTNLVYTSGSTMVFVSSGF